MQTSGLFWTLYGPLSSLKPPLAVSQCPEMGSSTFSRSRWEEVVLVLLWRGTSKRLGRQSWTSRGQNLVNGRDLSSNSPSGGTSGLISEVLKVGFYGVCYVLKSFCFTCSFHYTEANCDDNGKVNCYFLPPIFTSWNISGLWSKHW